MELPVVELDGADVLLAALHGLPLAVALDSLATLGTATASERVKIASRKMTQTRM